jgi:hypothetical protein
MGFLKSILKLVLRMVKKSKFVSNSGKIATFLQSARCPVVKQPNLAALSLGARGQ